VAACDRFIYLEVLGNEDASADAESEPDDEAAALIPQLRPILTAAVDSTSADDGWTTLSAVGTHISKNNPSFDSRNYGFQKLVELARAQDYVDVEQNPGSPVRVRLTSSRPAKKSTARRSSATKKATQGTQKTGTQKSAAKKSG
jgi:hypothetical protein